MPLVYMILEADRGSDEKSLPGVLAEEKVGKACVWRKDFEVERSWRGRVEFM